MSMCPHDAICRRVGRLFNILLTFHLCALIMSDLDEILFFYPVTFGLKMAVMSVMSVMAVMPLSVPKGASSSAR